MTDKVHLPRELRAKIFRQIWRSRDAAVCVQKHVRGCIARAAGAPWDMPALLTIMSMEEVDARMEEVD